MKSDYHEKQERRKERYEELAEKNRKESDNRWEASRNISDQIPFGQPILIGHHSEKRHRAALKKLDGHARKSVKCSEKAKYYDKKAKGVGKAGISSDNPDAIQELQLRLADMQRHHEFMKRVNREYRKGGWAAVTGLSDDFKERAKASMSRDWRKNPKPFEGYELTNNGANMRRIKQRIAQLEAAEKIQKRPDIQGNEYIIRESKEDNRIMIIFDGKPEADIRTVVKREGFRWAPSVKAWVRMLNGQGRYAATSVFEKLG